MLALTLSPCHLVILSSWDTPQPHAAGLAADADNVADGAAGNGVECLRCQRAAGGQRAEIEVAGTAGWREAPQAARCFGGGIDALLGIAPGAVDRLAEALREGHDVIRAIERKYAATHSANQYLR